MELELYILLLLFGIGTAGMPLGGNSGGGLLRSNSWWVLLEGLGVVEEGGGNAEVADEKWGGVTRVHFSSITISPDDSITDICQKHFIINERT